MNRILERVLFSIALLLVTERCVAERPNFLIILTDDQSPYTLKAYGNQVCETENLDRLAARGMTFDAAYHMGAWVGGVCTPSRHMIMTGRTVWHIPGKRRARRRNQPAPPPQNPQERDPTLVPPNLANFSMPAIFNRAGYDTFRTCKRGNSYAAANALFQVRHEASKRGGTPETGSQWHGDRAVEYLEKRQTSGDKDPFLMYLGFSHPHDTRDGTPELLKKYGAANVKQPPTEVNPAAPPLPPNYLSAHPFHHGHPGLRDEVKVSGVFESRTEATVRNETGREYACIENIDNQIGRVLDQLEAMGELDNTYIIFTADHGMSVGRHGLMGKQNLYEHTWRVPFIVAGPGIQANSRATGNIYLLDILPTLCDFADIEPPATIEGKSFRPILEQKAKTVREVLYGVYCGGTKPGMRSLRKGDWKLIKYDVLDGKVQETQLFNLKDNPHEFLQQHHDASNVALTGTQPTAEQVNLADDPRYAEIRIDLEATLLAEQKRLDDPFRLWDQKEE